MRRAISAGLIGFVTATLVVTSAGVAVAATTSAPACNAIDAPKAMNDLPASADCNEDLAATGGIHSNALAAAVTPVAPTSPINATPWPFDRTNGDILAITKIDGTNNIAFGGNFSLVFTPDGISHPAASFAVVNQATGAMVYAGNPSNSTAPADIYVRSIASFNGTIYMGGDFTAWDGVPRVHAASLSPSFAVTAWNPAPTGTVRGMATDGTGVYMGGDMAVALGVNATTGAQLWSKAVTGGSVHAVMFDQGAVFFGGLFEVYDGVTQHGVVKVTPSTGALVTAFNANLRADTGVGPDGNFDGEDIIAMSVGPNNGQIFIGAGGHANPGLSSNETILTNITTGARVWKFSTIGDTQAIGVVGDTVVAGYHNNGADQNNPLSANHFGIQLENSNGTPTTWDPLINGNQDNADGGNNGVQAIYVDQINDIIYIAGAFEHWNGITGLTHASLIAFSYTPANATAPGAPTGVTAVAGNGNANVSWTPPVSSGGSPITGYTVTSSPGGLTATAPTATPVTVSGLTNGTSYTFTVRATNVVGTGPASSPSAAVSPAAGGGLANSAEGGTSGTSVTAANSGGGSGDPFTVVNKGAGATLVYSPTVPAHGARDYALTTSSGTATDVGWSGFNTTSMAARFYFNPGSTLPSTLVRLADIRNASGTAARVMLSATNQVLVQNTAGSTVTTFAHALAPNTWYRIEVAISASPTVATINAAYFLGDALTPVDPAFATTSGNTGSANITQVLMGSAASSTFIGTAFIDDLAVQPASTSFIGKATAPSVPGAPTAVTAVAGNSSAVVSWGAPASNGSPLSSYSITSSPAGFTGTAAGSATSVNATGLTNGTAYTFTVTATNGVGAGPASAPSAAVTPAVAPGAPTAVSAVGANTSATVSWTAPSSNGGNPITGYTVTSSPDGVIATTAGATSVAVTGLTNGTPYTFTVVATNAVGPGPASAASTPVTPAPTAPAAPTTVSAVAGDSSATVSWSAPTSDGGSAITGYTVTSSPGGLTGTTAGATTVPVTGLTNNTAYTFTVVATNGVGTGASSAASNAVTPVPAPTAPGAPTGVTAVAGNATATVSWVAPASNGGSPITGYTVTSSPGGLIGTTSGATTVAVTGLTNGIAYTFTVVAANNVGPGPASAPSAPVTPTPPSGSLSNSAEGGTSGTAVSTANSGGASGNALTVINRGSGATLNFSSTAPAHGSRDYLITGKSGTVTDEGWNGFNTSSMATRFYYNPGSSLPNSVIRLADIRNASGTAARVELSAANQIFIQNNAGTTITTFSHALQANTWYRVELAISASSSAATIKAAFYLADSTTPVDPMFSTTTGNTGAANLTQALFGSTASATWTGTSFFDDLAASPSTTLFIGPVAAAPTAPGAPTGVSAVAGDGTATVSWTAPVSNGGSAITGYVVTSSPGGLTGSTSGTSVAVNGLTNGTPYTFTVVASNVAGPGPASAPSTAVTPTAAATAPGAPTGVSAVAGNGSATVSWTAPASNGGSAITGYVVTSSPGGLTGSTAGTSVAVNGLTNGTPYTFTVVASNVAGPGPASAPSTPVTPTAAATAPGAPTGVSAVAGNGSATVSWTAPASNGGSAITGYVVTSSPGGFTGSTAGTSVAVNGLTNGTSYTFTVVASNIVGPGPASAPSSAVTPNAAATAPGAPTGVTATAGDASASVSWIAPVSDGGSAITGYTVTVLPGGATFQPVGTATTVNVTGLTNGTSYTFTVVATNSVSDGPASDPSSPVIPAPAPPTAPGAPTGVTATAGDASASVSWIAPVSDGGSAITGYTVTVLPGGATFQPVGTATTVNVTGLTNGTSYTFTVVATNSVSDGPPSAPSAPVTPTAAATAPGAPTGVTAIAGNGSATVSWTAPASNGGSAITGYTVTASPGGAFATTNGATTVVVSGLTNGTAVTFTVVATNGVGTGPASAASTAVTPTAPAGGTANSAEGGTAGTSVTVANSGGASGNAFTVVSKGAGAALVYTASSAAHGGRAYALTGASGTATIMGWNGLNATSEAVRFYFNTGSSLPNSVLRLADIRNATGTAARVELSAANQIFIQNNAGTTIATFAHALQPNTWYRVEMTISVSSSAATIKAAYYVGDSLAPVDPSFSTTTGNTGSATITQVSIGSTASATWTGTALFDDIAAQSSSTTFIGPVASTVPGAPLTVTAVAGSGSATVSWSAPVTNGGSPITSYTVTSAPDGVTATTSGTSVIVNGLTAGTSYTFTVVATNGVGPGAASALSNAVIPT